jgi:glycerol-1-phosphate dehydrogenase [NAD(P)+]
VIRGLILSGIAMEMAGSSRPASGPEHLISHALDVILERPHPHGLQVAVATIAAGLLRGGDERSLVPFYRLVGLPVVPGDLGIPIDDFIAAIRSGPATRPGRRTCLDDVEEADIGRLRDLYEHDAI